MPNPPASFSDPNGTGVYKDIVNWLDLSPVTAGSTTVTITNDLTQQYSGYTITLTIEKDTRALFSTTVPTHQSGSNGTAFGITGYQNISGSPAIIFDTTLVPLYTSNTASFTISDIHIEDSSGNPITNYKLVVADAHYCAYTRLYDYAELIHLDATNAAGPWKLIETLDNTTHNPIDTPIVTGSCGNPFEEIGNNPSDSTYTRAHIVAIDTPTDLSVRLKKIHPDITSKQAVAFGVILFEACTEIDPNTFERAVCTVPEKVYIDIPYSSTCGRTHIGFAPGTTTYDGNLGHYELITSEKVVPDSNPQAYTLATTGILFTPASSLSSNMMDQLEFYVYVNGYPQPIYNFVIDYKYSPTTCGAIDYAKSVLTNKVETATDIALFEKREIFFYQFTITNHSLLPVEGTLLSSGIRGIKITDTIAEGLMFHSDPTMYTISINGVVQTLTPFSTESDFTGSNYGYLIDSSSTANTITFYLPAMPAMTTTAPNYFLSFPIRKDFSDTIVPGVIIPNTGAIYYSTNSVEYEDISDNVYAKYLADSLLFTKTGNSTALVGEDYIYTITVKNQNTPIISNIYISDSLPSNFALNMIEDKPEIVIEHSVTGIVPIYNCYVSDNNRLWIWESPDAPMSLSENEFYTITIKGKFT